MMHGDRHIVDRDGPYVKYANGVVADTKTGLEWVAGPGKIMSWGEANQWAKSLDLDGSGWRLPTSKELETLYQEAKGKRNMTPLLETASWWVWSAEPDDGPSSSLFDFSRGTKDWQSRSPRAYAVRTPK